MAGKYECWGIGYQRLGQKLIICVQARSRKAAVASLETAGIRVESTKEIKRCVILKHPGPPAIKQYKKMRMKKVFKPVKETEND